MTPNNSFKPKLLRSGNIMAGKACHVVASTTHFGLTQALGAMSKFTWLLVFLLSACAAGARLAAGEVLTTNTYTLTVISHCREGEVGCSNLTATLVERATKQEVELAGSTYMVKCADGVTPCHVGFYDLKSANVSVRAYPDGTLELQRRTSVKIHESGSWSY